MKEPQFPFGSLIGAIIGSILLGCVLGWILCLLLNLTVGIFLDYTFDYETMYYVTGSFILIMLGWDVISQYNSEVNNFENHLAKERNDEREQREREQREKSYAEEQRKQRLKLENELQRESDELLQQFRSKYSYDGINIMVANNDFHSLLSKHEEKIIELEKGTGKNYVLQFVKLSNYLKNRKSTIESIYSKICVQEIALLKTESYFNQGQLFEITINLKETKFDKKVTALEHVRGLINDGRRMQAVSFVMDLCYVRSSVAEDWVEKGLYRPTITMNEFESLILSYDQVLMHGINMISALVNNKMFIFYEIYEFFDKLGIFESNWETKVIGRLDSINFSLLEINESIKELDRSLRQSLENLTYCMESSFSDLENVISNELSSINSNIQFNNMLTAIQTRKLYQIRSDTRQLN